MESLRLRSGLGLPVTSASRASELYPVRQLLEALCDRVTAGVEYGTVHFGLILNDATAKEIQTRHGVEPSILNASCHISRRQAAELRELAPILDALPIDAPVPDEALQRISLPLPRYVQGTGLLAMAESMFKFRSTRSSENVAGYSAVALDLDTHTVVMANDPDSDLFGLRAVAAAAWHNSYHDTLLLPDDLFDRQPHQFGRPPSVRFLRRYDENHPLAGTPIYEIAHKRLRLVPRYAAAQVQSIVANAPEGWHLESFVQAAIAEHILSLLHESGISPTCVTLSGRGLHLRWRLSEWVPARAGSRVIALQTTLHGLLKSMGSDSSCVTDRSRLLRVPGLMSGRTKTVAVRYRYQANHKFTHLLGSPRSLDGWCDQLFHETREQYRALHGNSAKSTSAHKSILSDQAKELRRDSLKQIGEKRIRGLFELALMRGGIRRGERNSFLWCASCLIASYLPEHVRFIRFSEFEVLVNTPLPDRDMQNLRNALTPSSGKRFNISNAYICDLLSVTDRELQEIPALRPVEPKFGPWKQTARSEMLVSLVQAGLPSPMITCVMGYKPGSVHVLTSRLYSKGRLSRIQVIRARREWRNKMLVKPVSRFGMRCFYRGVRMQASSVVPAKNWMADLFDVPGTGRLAPDDPRLRGVIDRTLDGISNMTRLQMAQGVAL